MHDHRLNTLSSRLSEILCRELEDENRLQHGCIKALSQVAFKIAGAKGAVTLESLVKYFDGRTLVNSLEDRSLSPGLTAELRSALATVPCINPDLKPDRAGIVEAYLQSFKFYAVSRLHYLDQKGLLADFLSGKISSVEIGKQM